MARLCSRRFSVACALLLVNACGNEIPTNGTDTGGAGGAGGAPDAASSGSSSSSSASSSSGQGGGPVAQPLTILTLNLHCLRVDGTVYATNTERFAAIASLVANRDVSAITLQEACQRPGENAIDELRVAIEKATSTSWSSTWTFAHVAWEGTPDQADEGVGLLVKGNLSNPDELVLAVQGSLRRVAASATLPAQWSNVRLTSIHFEVFEQTARTMQAREVAVAALVDTDPFFGAIVAGDFNDIEGSTTHAGISGIGVFGSECRNRCSRNRSRHGPPSDELATPISGKSLFGIRGRFRSSGHSRSIRAGQRRRCHQHAAHRAI
jgi:endonuclease/exonuclease/phosphatase family metal-dependent hydrolase